MKSEKTIYEINMNIHPYLKEENIMQWSTLLYLVCPIMMIYCMIGMRKPKDTKKRSEEPGTTQQEVQQLQIKMAEMMEQNQHLSREIQTLKQQRNSNADL